MDNYQAISYAILALDKKGYTIEQLQEIRGAMLYMMDMKSEEEAEELADHIMNRY